MERKNSEKTKLISYYLNDLCKVLRKVAFRTYKIELFISFYPYLYKKLRFKYL